MPNASLMAKAAACLSVPCVSWSVVVVPVAACPCAHWCSHSRKASLGALTGGGAQWREGSVGAAAWLACCARRYVAWGRVHVRPAHPVAR
eukprot:168590-Lingulodinium_polyedra.AAC.1